MPRLPAAIASLLLAACAAPRSQSGAGDRSGAAPATTSAARAAADPRAPCDGQRWLVVDNQTRGPVDVIVAPASTGTPQLLTTVRPGRQRVALAEPVLRAYAEQDGVRVSGGRGRRRGNDVTFSYACER